MNKKLKRFLHNFFKIFLIFMIGTLIINVVLFAVVYINHKSKCDKEAVYMQPPGEYVQVNGKAVHVYDTGNKESDITIVYLHSSMIADDSIAIMPMFDKLKDDYHLIYVDRSGYGYTKSNGADKDIDSILEETRSALAQVEAEGPYYIIASGTAGVEALYWACTYEDEVAGIIGMDMNYPKQFEGITTEEYAGFFDYIMSKFCKIGGMRLVPNAAPTDLAGIYSKVQMKTRAALINQRGYTDDMFEENEAMVENANKVGELGWPEDIPMHMLLANPITKPYIDVDSNVREKYEDAQSEDDSGFDYVGAYTEDARNYYDQFENVTYEEVSGPARLYTYCPDKVAESIDKFITETKKKQIKEEDGKNN